ncbi:MAG TPA: hypothetical protein VEU55_00025 [Gemmatimonadales bacterium]|nr:hypothetical protein [Gemmatimonadales bacterium]
MQRIALATYGELPGLNADDRLLIEPLAALGVTALPAVWDAAEVRWTEFAAVVVRSCWDYHDRLDEFLSWIGRLEGLQVPVWNPPDLLRWNSHKAYLRELATAGVATVPTRWLGRGERSSLAEVLHAERWSDAVVKPAVSASAHGTWRTSQATAARDQGRLDELLMRGDAMVQPFVNEVGESGEWSLMFLGGRFSHAVLQRPAAGDFRVQAQYGGSAAALTPPRHVLSDAKRVLAALSREPLYARVDGVERAGRLLLSELELIEPLLFLQSDPAAPARLARALAHALG